MTDRQRGRERGGGGGGREEERDSDVYIIMFVNVCMHKRRGRAHVDRQTDRQTDR